MATSAVAFPVLPGKTEAGRRFAQEVLGARRAEAEASWARGGISAESWFIQSTPMGDMVIVVMQAEDPARAWQEWAASQDPYDRWFKETAGAVCGLDFNQPLPAMPEQILDWHR